MNLESYINTFSEGQRDTVVGQIIKCKVIQDALETQAGKALLNSVIDSIRDKTMSILGTCIEADTKHRIEKINHIAMEVHVMYHLLRDWAQLIVDGAKHQEAMKK